MRLSTLVLKGLTLYRASATPGACLLAIGTACTNFVVTDGQNVAAAMS